MDAKNVIAALEQGLALSRSVVAVALPGAAPLVDAVSTFAEAALEDAIGAKDVIASTDLTQIESLTASIRAQNDALHGQVEAS
jgi:hypothetical protein